MTAWNPSAFFCVASNDKKEIRQYTLMYGLSEVLSPMVSVISLSLLVQRQFSSLIMFQGIHRALYSSV